MNKTLSKKEILLLIIVGLITTAISFIYYFVFKNPFKLVLYFILIIDLVLFFMNVYRLSLSFNKSKLKTILISILIMLGYFVFIEIMVFSFTLTNTELHSLQLFNNVFIISTFLSPCFIILLPIIWFVAEVLGWFYYKKKLCPFRHSYLEL